MTLNKKLFRDLYEHRGANIAAIIVIMIGIMIFNGAAITMDTLVFSKSSFYEKGNFPHAYASLIAAPKSTPALLKEIEGIRQAEGRLIYDAKVEDTSKTLRLMSTTYEIGKYVLHEGRDPRAGEDELLLYNKFAKANGYRIGDRISLILNGSVRRLRVCGIASSPETIYTIQDISSIFPNPENFGIGFIDLKTLQRLTGKDSFNEIIVTLEMKRTFEDLKDSMEKVLRPYGLVQLYSMKDQTSNVMVDGEIEELRASMITMPLIFLGAAALVMSIMVKRIIEQQRGQIGILKAFGYSDWSVGAHYSLYCLILGMIGGILGGLLGFWFSDVLLGMYQQLFNMEYVNNSTTMEYFIIGILISGGFSTTVGIRTSIRAVNIMPSEAMREEAPQNGTKSFVERFFFFNKIFDSKGIMSIRNITRNKKRSFFVILGFAMAFAISVLPWTMLFLLDEMVYERFDEVERYDAKVYLSDLQSKKKAERELGRFPGIFLSEGMLEVPATLSFAGIKQDVRIIGLIEDSSLYTVVDSNKEPVSVDSDGIVVSERLAEKLKVVTGDDIWIQSPYSKYKEDKKKVRITGVVEQSIGMNGYMEIEMLSEVLGYMPVSNVVLLDVRGDNAVEELRIHYQDAKEVKSIQSKKETIEQVSKRMDMMYVSLLFMALLASAMSFAIVYNTYIVVLLERKREFSTLMVLGMGDKEVLSIISLEQWMMTVLGMLIGTPIAKAFIIVIGRGLSTDMFTLPTTINLQAVLISVFLMGISVLLAQMLAGKKIADVDIVDALKSAE